MKNVYIYTNQKQRNGNLSLVQTDFYYTTVITNGFLCSSQKKYYWTLSVCKTHNLVACYKKLWCYTMYMLVKHGVYHVFVS